MFTREFSQLRSNQQFQLTPDGAAERNRQLECSCLPTGGRVTVSDFMK